MLDDAPGRHKVFISVFLRGAMFQVEISYIQPVNCKQINFQGLNDFNLFFLRVLRGDMFFIQNKRF